MSESRELHFEYEALRERALRAPLAEVAHDYERLYEAASGAKDTALQRRCLADLGALSLPHDKVVGRQLLDAAVALGGADAGLCENLARLERSEGDVVEAIRWAARAVEAALEEKDVVSAAGAIDLLMQLYLEAEVEPAERDSIRRFGTLLAEARPAGAGRDEVLLIGDLRLDGEAMRARAAELREGERPVRVLALRGFEEELAEGIGADPLWLEVRDPLQIPVALAGQVPEGFERVEVFAGRDRALWSLVACVACRRPCLDETGLYGVPLPSLARPREAPA